jgi:undecaprenyl diphosphate synthase
MDAVTKYKLWRDLDFHSRVDRGCEPLDLLVIPDGNRTRVSRMLGKSKSEFSREDYRLAYEHFPETIKRIVGFLKGVSTRRLYFWGNSPENLINRSRECVEEALDSYLHIIDGDWLAQERVRIHLKGDLDLFDQYGYGEYHDKFLQLQRDSRRFNHFHLYFFLNYNTREDIRKAISKMGNCSKLLDFESVMDEPAKVDVILRTGGLNRLSGFSLVKSPDALFYGIQKSIAEFDINDMVLLLLNYRSTVQNHGR